MKIFAFGALKSKFFSVSRIAGVEFVDDEHAADFIFKPTSWDDHVTDTQENVVYFMEYNNKRTCTRVGDCVDDRLNLPKLNRFGFSRNEVCNDPRVIHVPVGFNIPRTISRQNEYWKKQSQPNICYNDKLYWCGSVHGHETRETVHTFYQKLNSPRFDVREFQQKIYHKPCSTDVHDDYLSELRAADMSFCLRGDRPSTHSFFDVIQQGCIPVLINNHDIGWENILNNVDDYMLRFNLYQHSIDYIHQEIDHVLSDKHRVLQMKRNCLNMFEKLFKYQDNDPWGDFVLAKILQIKASDDMSRIDNKLMCEEYINLRGWDRKL